MKDKTCTKCKVSKSRDNFYKRSTAKDGLRPHCKSCVEAYDRKETYICDGCGVPFKGKPHQRKLYNNTYCTRPCYLKNRVIRKTSSMEDYILNKLNREYSSLIIEPGATPFDSNLELDIYFPDLNIAIEVNGPTHYKPIYGMDKYLRQLENDKRKRLSCEDLGIQLYELDISDMDRLTDKVKATLWESVINILNKHYETT